MENKKKYETLTIEDKINFIENVVLKNNEMAKFYILFNDLSTQERNVFIENIDKINSVQAMEKLYLEEPEKEVKEEILDKLINFPHNSLASMLKKNQIIEEHKEKVLNHLMAGVSIRYIIGLYIENIIDSSDVLKYITSQGFVTKLLVFKRLYAIFNSFFEKERIAIIAEICDQKIDDILRISDSLCDLLNEENFERIINAITYSSENINEKSEKFLFDTLKRYPNMTGMILETFIKKGRYKALKQIYMISDKNEDLVIDKISEMTGEDLFENCEQFLSSEIVKKSDKLRLVNVLKNTNNLTKMALISLEADDEIKILMQNLIIAKADINSEKDLKALLFLIEYDNSLPVIAILDKINGLENNYLYKFRVAIKESAFHKKDEKSYYLEYLNPKIAEFNKNGDFIKDKEYIDTYYDINNHYDLTNEEREYVESLALDENNKPFNIDLYNKIDEITKVNIGEEFKKIKVDYVEDYFRNLNCIYSGKEQHTRIYKK